MAYSLLDFLLSRMGNADPSDPGHRGVARPEPSGAFLARFNAPGVLAKYQSPVTESAERIVQQQSRPSTPSVPAAQRDATPQRTATPVIRPTTRHSTAADTLLTGEHTGPDVERWKAVANSPYVRDTLYEVAGGPPSSIGVADRLTQSIDARRQQGTGAFASGIVDAQSTVPGENVMLALNAQRKDESTLAHEMGHLSDYRGNIPQLDQISDRYYEDFRRRDHTQDDDSWGQRYMAANPQEFKAETFARGMNLVRMWGRSVDDMKASGRDPQTAFNEYMAQVDGNPEIGHVVDMMKAILQHPVYRDTPVGQLMRNYQDSLSGIYHGSQR